ncbi:MAG: hypothetical protein H0T46_22815 [Deltaproteobacteria bacterium]|nr:hypothetical protein [Deltaproteobacteria bacterium]
MSDLPINDLASESLQTRRGATEAIADSVDRGTPLDAAAEAVVARFADPDPGIRQLATYILQTDAERPSGGRTVAALRAALTSDVADERRGAAFVYAGCLARQEQGHAVAALIDNPDRMVRAGVLKALADGAVPRAQTDAVVTALVRALADNDVATRKEVIWAIYLLGSEGAAIDAAVPQLEEAIGIAATQANAAIALSLAWHNANESDRADALYASASGNVQMGAAWGAADVYLKRDDLAALKRMFAHDNDNVRRGLGAFLHHARGQKRDLSLAGQAFSELERDHATDGLLHARLYAVADLAKRGPGG